MIFKNSEFLTLEKLKSNIENIKGMSSLNVAWTNEIHFNQVFYKNIPVALCGVEGVDFKDLHLIGELEVNDHSWSLYKRVFVDLGKDISQSASASVAVYFNEKESRQDKGGSDSVRIRKMSGKLYFDYISNGSKINSDKDYALITFEKMFNSLSIPISIDSGEGFYTLRHSAGLELRLSDGLLGRNSGSFYCEIPDVTDDKLIEMLRKFVEEFTTGQLYSVEWAVGYNASTDGANPDSQKLIDIYNTAVEKKLPAEKYVLNVNFKLESLDGLESIRPLCKEGNEIEVLYGNVKSGNDNTVVHIILKEDGYAICISAGSESNIEKLTTITDLVFT